MVKKIVIDQGHGYGTEHNRGGVLFNEGDQNYRFGVLLKKKIEEYEGVNVVLTRNNIKENPSLSARAKMGIGADLFISTHTNAADSTVRGMEIFRSKNNVSNVLLNRIQAMGVKTLGTKDRGVKYRSYNGGDYWGVFNWGNNARVKMLIEWVFHTNKEDSQVYLKKQDELATNTARLIAEYYELKKKNTVTIPETNSNEAIYSVQLGAFQNEKNAETLLDSLNAKGFKGIIVKDEFAGFYEVIARVELAIRKEPTTNSNKIGGLKAGEVVAIEKINGNWAKLRGRDGYVGIKYLKKK